MWQYFISGSLVCVFLCIYTLYHILSPTHAVIGIPKVIFAFLILCQKQKYNVSEATNLDLNQTYSYLSLKCNVFYQPRLVLGEEGAKWTG